MVKNKKQLKLIRDCDDDIIIDGTTCFSAQAKYKVDCQRTICKHWIDHSKTHNCVLIAVQEDGPHTLQKVGQIYDLSRMRICQIEKEIFEKIRKMS